MQGLATSIEKIYDKGSRTVFIHKESDGPISQTTVGAAVIYRGFPPAITLGNLALRDLSIDTAKENRGFISHMYSEGIVANNADGSSRSTLVTIGESKLNSSLLLFYLLIFE
ncbi:hypothetical protein Q3G72_007334 [Acer saccharum]|nr:hypothetical protein Q3G72_007334 [Acer saccharum]